MTAATPESDPASLAAEPPGGRRRRPQWWRGFLLLPKPMRVSAYLAVLVVLALVAVTLTGVVVVRRSFPQTSGTVEVPGLGADVDVVRDDHGIPQIYADTTEDLMYAEGYVHAQERFFEMDVRRHATAGRLAELFGQDAVESDVYVRTMGWRRVAEQELALLSPETRAALDSYAAGVNAYLDGRSGSRISVEYTLLDLGGLDYTPEKWTAVDSLAWLKAMAWDLRGNMQDEIDRVLSTDAVGRSRAEELWPAYDYDDATPAVRQGAVVDGVYEQDATSGGTRNPTRPPAFAPAATDALTRVSRGLDRLPALLGRGDGLGSNAWVVDGDRTASGEPILANDPHLGASVPGVWMQVGLHCRAISDACPYDVAGFSFSGVPGVVIGHNADIAWGFTNLGPDVTDLYVERVRGDRWQHGTTMLPLRTRQETIEVADGDDVDVTVRSTSHGPIISDADDVVSRVGSEASVGKRDPGSEYAVSLSWTALTPAPTADALLALDRAGDWDTFRAAVSDFAAPSQNIVYADREGHIGYQAPGLVPIRKSGNDGRMPSAGWRPENDWTGEYVPYDGLPSVLDPDEGMVVTANQAVVGPEYPYFLTDDWDRGYRSERIRDLLSDRDDLDVDDMLDIQLDTQNQLAPTLVPYLEQIRLPRGYWSDGQRLLGSWHFDQPTDSGAAAYFNAVWRNLLAITFHDELPEDVWPDGGQRWYAVVSRLLRDPHNAYWDDVTTDEDVETRDDVLRAALRAARDELTSREAANPDDWSWGGLHDLELRSPSLGRSGIGVVERLLNRGGWEAPGGSAAVNATSWDAAEGYEVTSAPSMRMVIDLADLDDSRWVNLTGVSGHALNDHYTDQTDLWADGRTLPWLFTSEAVKAAGDDVLTLTPAPGQD